MKNTKKNSQISNNTWWYIILLLILVASVGGFCYYWFVHKPKVEIKEELAFINDTSKVKRDSSDYTSANIISKAKRNIRKKAKCQEKLAKSKLSTKKKQAFQEVLDNIITPEMEENELMNIDDHEEKIRIINQILDEDSKLDRLEEKIDPERIKLVTKLFKEEQPTWLKNDFPQEKNEIIKKIDDTFKRFYYQFLDEIVSKDKEEREAMWVDPIMVKSELTTDTNRQQHIAYIKSRKFKIHDENNELHEYPQPLKDGFLGFTDVLSKKEEKDQAEKEGTLLGLTISEKDKYPIISLSKDYHDPEEKDKFTNFYCYPYPLPIRIKLKKEFFFGRKGEDYDEWIDSIEKKENGQTWWTPVDISFEMLIETIAHELAHAVIETSRFKYAENNGGHGPLHNDYTTRIRKMIENSSEYKEFQRWWWKKE